MDVYPISEVRSIGRVDTPKEYLKMTPVGGLNLLAIRFSRYAHAMQTVMDKECLQKCMA